MSKELLEYNRIEKRIKNGSHKSFSRPARNPAIFSRRIANHLIAAGADDSDKEYDFPDYVYFPYEEFKRKYVFDNRKFGFCTIAVIQLAFSSHSTLLILKCAIYPRLVNMILSIFHSATKILRRR